MFSEEIIRSKAEFRSLADTWATLASASSRTRLFNSFEWAQSWLEIYWEDSYRLHIVLVKDETRPIAILPLYFNSTKGAYYVVGTGEPEFAEVCSEYVDFIIADDYEESESLNSLIAKHLGHLSELALVNCLSDSHAFRIASACPKTIRVPTGKQYFLDLEGGFQDIAEGFSAKERKKAQQALNRYNRHDELTFQLLENENYRDYWNLLKQIHQDEWQKKGRPGAFVAPQFNQFHHYLNDHHPEVRQFFSVLRWADEVIAIHHFYFYRNVNYFYLTGSRKGSHARLSPGMMLHILTISALGETGQTYDFLKGAVEDSYKAKLSKPGEHFYTVSVYGSSLSGVLRYQKERLRGAVRRLRRQLR